MITCESLTVEKVTAELAVLKAEPKKLQKRVEAAGILYGIESAEVKRYAAALLAAATQYRKLSPKLRALLAVLKAEQTAAEPKPEEPPKGWPDIEGGEPPETLDERYSEASEGEGKQ